MPALLSGYVAGKLTGGPECEGLERDLEAYYGVPHARVFNSATSALHASLVAVGVKPGKQVIVPSYSMSASAASIIHAGAVPVFGDIDDNYCLARDDYRRLSGPETAALVFVYLFGHHPFGTAQPWLPCTIPVIHDCAQAPSLKPNRRAGPRNVWVYSFNQHKIMSTGEGGYALTFDGGTAERLHLMRNHGESFSSDILGYNYRMTEPTAAIGRRELEWLDERLLERRQWAAVMSDTYGYHDRDNRDWYRFPIIVNGPPVDAERVARKVGGQRGYVTPTHKMPWFRANGYMNITLPKTEWTESHIVTVTP